MRQMPRLRALKKKRTRDAIIDAALRLFEAKGFAATTVEDIAAAAEVAPRTFYRYFPTKEDVAFIDQDAEDKAVAQVLADNRPGESDLDLLTRGIQAVLAVSEGKLDRVAAMYKVVLETPEVQARALQIMLEGERRIVEALAARAGRTPEAEFRARVLAACATAVARAAFTHWIESGQQGSPGRHCDRAVALLRSGFAPSSRPRGRR